MLGNMSLRFGWLRGDFCTKKLGQLWLWLVYMLIGVCVFSLIKYFDFDFNLGANINVYFIYLLTLYNDFKFFRKLCPI